MSDKQTVDEKHNQYPYYEIRLKGHLDGRWAEWFEGLTITLEADGNMLLTGPMVDQAALHGLLKKVRDSGLVLVSVNHIVQKKEIKMNAYVKDASMKDRKVALSTLWIFAMLNYIYADVFTLFFSSPAQNETPAMPKEAVLVFAILMEIAIAMVLLSRFLKYGANRWANMIAGVFFTAFVAWSMIGETPAPFYLFFASIEMVCTLFIAWYAWKWRTPEGQPES